MMTASALGAAVIARDSPAAITGGRVDEEQLPRQLGLWSTTALTIGAIIGVGIFRSPAAIAANTGSVGRFALVWVNGGVLALIGALAFGELGAMYPRSGGTYVFLREAYGEPVAFTYGWTMLIINPAGGGAIALVFADYLGQLIPITPLGARVAAVAMILVSAMVGYYSTRAIAVLQNTATIGKLIAIAGMIVLAFALGGSISPGAQLSSVPVTQPGLGQFGIALVTALYPYYGWHAPAGVVGEVRDPGRTFPRALVLGISTVVLLYLAVNAAYLHVVSFARLSRSTLVAADVMRELIGQVGGRAVSAAVMVSAFGVHLVGALVVPRIYYTMAVDGLSFKAMAAVHPRHRTPHVAIAFVAILTALFASTLTWDQLQELRVVGAWPFLTLAVLGVVVLRRTRPAQPRPFTTPIYAVPLFVVASLALIGNIAVQHPVSTLGTFGFSVLGVPVYYAWRAARREWPV